MSVLAAAVVTLAPLLARADAPSDPIAAVIDRGKEAMRSDPDASKRDAEQALEMLKRQPNVDLEIEARLLLCDYQSERDPQAARQQISAATELLPNAKRAGLRAGIRLCEGATHEYAGENTAALAEYEQAEIIARHAHDEDMLAEGSYDRGYLLGVVGNYADGLTELRRAQELYDKLNKPLHSLTVLNSIATVYNGMGDYPEARHTYTRALKAQREMGLQRDTAVTLHNLGRSDEKLSDWESARQHYSESLGIFRQINYARGEAYAQRGLAMVANASGDPAGALKMLESAQVLQRQVSDARLNAQIQLARGIALHKLQRLSESTVALEGALEGFQQAQSLAELAAAHSELAEVYAESGNWHAAFERERDARTASDRLLKNQLDQRFATLKVEFDTAARERENAALLRENEANAKALSESRRVRALQATVILLTVLLATILAMLAIFQWRKTRRMRALAMTDELTGVPNRRAVLAQLDLLLRCADPAPCAILIIDIDHFKTINDHHGHPAGDEVLKLVADKVRLAVSEPAFFGRLGGEEFLIVLPEASLDEARRMAETFRQRIESVDTMRWFTDRRRITASIGVALSSPGRDTLSTLLGRADFALYAAKRGGRNCVRTEPASEPESHNPLLERQAQ